MRTLGWWLQLLALIIVGTALLVGLIYNELRTEVAMLGTGGVVFLLGRWLRDRED